MHNPFAKSKPSPKRERPRRTGDRVRLKGEAKTQRRREIFERSGGRCEAERLWIGFVGMASGYIRCNRPITWETFEWSHPKHGPYKDDRYGIASCKECHQVGVHNPKACPRKAGRKMNQKEARANWQSIVCFCTKPKRQCSSFCAPCLDKLEPQLQFDVLNATGENYLKAVALAEQALLAWKPAEEKVG